MNRLSHSRLALRSAPKRTQGLAPFSLSVLVVNLGAIPLLLAVGVGPLTYYALFAMYLLTLGFWLVQGDVTEDFLALSVMFVAFYVLLPEPMLSEAQYYFWNAPSEFNNPNSSVLLMCGAFLATATFPTLWRARMPREFAALPVVRLRVPVLGLVALSLIAFAALFPSILLQTRAEVRTQVGQEGGALRQLLLVTAPRGLAGGYLIALAISACGRIARQKALPLAEMMLALPAVAFFNPVAISRQLLLTGFLAVIFILSRFRIFDRKWILVCLPLVSVVLAPAISNITRYEARNDVFPFAPDFDVHQNIALAMQLVELEGHRFGLHLLASLSTVLPSELKLFQAEHLLASGRLKAIYSQTNISLPIFVEFFVDFGWIGVVIMTYALFAALRKLQERVYYHAPSLWLLGVSAIISANWLSLNRGPFLGNSPVLIFFILGWTVCVMGLKLKEPLSKAAERYSRHLLERRTG